MCQNLDAAACVRVATPYGRLMGAVDMVQAGLERQQQALADQLKQALELHMHPRTAVDTMTVADKAINFLEKLIQVRLRIIQDP